MWRVMTYSLRLSRSKQHQNFCCIDAATKPHSFAYQIVTLEINNVCLYVAKMCSSIDYYASIERKVDLLQSPIDLAEAL